MSIFEAFVLVGAVVWLANLLAPWGAWRTRECLNAESSSAMKLSDYPSVSILIPARNEALVIAQTLRGIERQTPDIPVRIVNDQSTDDTKEVSLKSKLPIQVIDGLPPPAGWAGKLWALEQGLKHVDTEFVLIMDADIDLQSGILEKMMLKARSENIDFLSLMAELNFASFWERLLMPAYIYFFKLLYPFSLANSARSNFSSGAGGCILVRKAVFERIGGYRAIKDALIDDCSLAKAVKSAGFKTWIGLTRSVQSHRAYEGLGEIWQLVARSAFTYLRYSAFLLFVCSLLMVAAFWFLPLSLFILPTGSVLFWISCAGCTAMLAAYIPTLRFYGLSPLWSLFLPVSGSLYLSMTWTSAISYWRGKRSAWKGRVYDKNLRASEDSDQKGNDNDVGKGEKIHQVG
ncbi:MAG: glycosyltransferase [Bradymonadales bacterium]|nr:MAG: glycosyltransferase [Bradymonadales bacterium]